MVKNEKTTNSLTKTKTKTKKYKTIENEKIENENAKTAKLVTQRKCYSIQYGAYGCYGRTS